MKARRRIALAMSQRDDAIEELKRLDAQGMAGAEKFGWRVERDVQGRTNVIGQAQGGNGP